MQQRAAAAAAANVTMSNGNGENVLLKTKEEEAMAGGGVAVETRKQRPIVMNNTDLHREIPALPAAAATLEKPVGVTEATSLSLTNTP